MKQTITKCDLCRQEARALMKFRLPSPSTDMGAYITFRDIFRIPFPYTSVEICGKCLEKIQELRREQIEKEDIEFEFKTEETV